MTKARMVVCNGTSQLMFATSCLESSQQEGGEDHLWIYTVDHSLEREQKTGLLASELHDWASIRYCRIDSDLSVPFELDNEFDLSLDELWMCMPSNPVERSLQNRFEDAVLVFYEDGLHAYNERYDWGQLVRRPRRFAKWMLMKAKRLLSRFSLLPSRAFPFRPIDEAYLILGDQLKLASHYRPQKKQTVIPAERLVSVAGRIASVDGFRPPSVNEPEKTVVFLGCIFAECGMASWDEELDVYRSTIQRMLDLGYDVLWKEHPRAQQPFAEQLQLEFQERVFTQSMNKLIPAEVFFAVNKVAGCLSPHSTALLMLPRFDVPVFHLTQACQGFYNESYRPAVELVQKHVPSVDVLKPFVK